MKILCVGLYIEPNQTNIDILRLLHCPNNVKRTYEDC